MATQQLVGVVSLPAAGDLSTKQYYFVKIDSSGNVDVAGNGERFIGILQNKPAALGEACEVAISGISKVIQSGSLTIGASVAPDASGTAEAATAGDDGSCVLLENGGGASTFGSCLLHAGCQA